MNIKQKYSNLINSIEFQQATKIDILDELKFYANNNIKTISTKDYNTIFMLYSIKEKYFKNEIINRLSKNTLLEAFNLIK